MPITQRFTPIVVVLAMMLFAVAALFAPKAEAAARGERCNPPGPSVRGVWVYTNVYRNFARPGGGPERFVVGERLVCVSLRSGNYVP